MIDKRYIDKPGDLSILNPMDVTVDVGKSAHKINKVPINNIFKSSIYEESLILTFS